MHILGELERLLSETLYPYRIPLTGGALLLLLAGGVWVWRAGWFHRLLSAARRRPGPYALLALARSSPPGAAWELSGRTALDAKRA